MYNRIKLNMLDERCDCEYVISRQEDWGDPYPRIFIEMYIGEGYSWDDLDTYICDPSNEENIIKLQRVSPGYTDGWHVAVLRYIDINHFANIGKFIMYVYNGEERLNLRLIYFKFSGVEESGEWIVTPNHSWEYGHITFNINGYHASSGGGGGGGGGGTSYTPGDGIQIENDEISVKKGDGLEFTEDGTLSLTQATETQRGGIILGRGLAYDSTTGKTNTVPNIQQAVIIQEKDAAYILHEYTTVEYIAGNRIGYAGAQNPIILQGYTIYGKGAKAPNGNTIQTYSDKANDNSFPDIPLYPCFSFKEAAIYNRNTSQFVSSINVKPNTISSVKTSYIISIEGVDSTISSSFAGYENMNENTNHGMTLVYYNIYPPGYSTGGKTFTYGCASCGAIIRYKSSNNYYTFYVDSVCFYIGFASEAEYNAAVGLTYEPNTLTMIVDNKEVTG